MALYDLVPKILARGMKALRSECLMTRLVNTDFSVEAAKRGETIDIPISSAQTTEDVVPGPTPPASPQPDVETAKVVLSNWKKSSFYLTDQDLARIEADKTYIPLQMSEAFQALAQAINKSVFDHYVDVFNVVGTAGTTPFETDVTAATQSRKMLNAYRADKKNRVGILDWDAEANALALPQFSDAEKTGSPEEKITGEIGRKFGIYWAADEDVPTHVAGDAAGYTVSGGHTAGDQSIDLTGGTGTFNPGDIVSFAGHSQTYTVINQVTNTINIKPALVTNVADGAAVTKVDTHVVNLVFHRDAFALAIRSPQGVVDKYLKPEYSFVLPDPKTGLVFRLEVLRQYKQIVWELDCMWGAACVRPQTAVRLLG